MFSAWFLAGPSAGQQPADIAAGQKLAAINCRDCHAIGHEPAAVGIAPSFAAIARDPASSEFRLWVFLRSTPHPVMPSFVLSETETNDLIAFILSLRRP
jgi:mono/diheme cytochrome c family protein